MFSLEAYRSNPDRCIAQVGWWLRRFVSLRLLPVTSVRKVFLDLRATLPAIGSIMQRELELVSPERTRGEVSALPYLDNDAYDEFLSRNLVFLHLYDASAANTLVECIQRTTPLLVNPLDAVVEYLGAEYPLYFHHRTVEPGSRAHAAHTHAAAPDARDVQQVECFWCRSGVTNYRDTRFDRQQIPQPQPSDRVVINDKHSDLIHSAVPPTGRNVCHHQCS